MPIASKSRGAEYARIVGQGGRHAADVLGGAGQGVAKRDFPYSFAEALAQRPGDASAEDDHFRAKQVDHAADPGAKCPGGVVDKLDGDWIVFLVILGEVRTLDRREIDSFPLLAHTFGRVVQDCLGTL